VANSSLVTIDLETFYPEGEVVAFDLKDYLFMELILKEKDFREALKTHDWAQYRAKTSLCFAPPMRSFRCGHICWWLRVCRALLRAMCFRVCRSSTPSLLF
jgi:hypothetical protein